MIVNYAFDAILNIIMLCIKFSRRHFEILSLFFYFILLLFFFFFSKEIGLDISCKFSTNLREISFSYYRKNKNVISLLSAELHRECLSINECSK